MSVARTRDLVGALLVGGAALAVAACAGSGGDDGGSRCGPTQAVVDRVIDGDTVELDSGERIRYLLIDTPEITGGANDCYGDEARQFNSDLVLGQEITLSYDIDCEDNFDRLLAFVSARGVEVNSRMVERGYACSLFIPPNGAARQLEFDSLEAQARSESRGMWGACEEVTCD